LGRSSDCGESQEKRKEAYQIAHSICESEENELDYLRQENTLDQLRSAPFEVPDEYWNDYGDDGRWYKKTLTRKGEAWARHEMKKLQRADVEFWFKLVVPIVALVTSIVALVRKH
jgi:hypothetical protein